MSVRAARGWRHSTEQNTNRPRIMNQGNWEADSPRARGAARASVPAPAHRRAHGRGPGLCRRSENSVQCPPTKACTGAARAAGRPQLRRSGPARAPHPHRPGARGLEPQHVACDCPIQPHPLEPSCTLCTRRSGRAGPPRLPSAAAAGPASVPFHSSSLS